MKDSNLILIEKSFYFILAVCCVCMFLCFSLVFLIKQSLFRQRYELTTVKIYHVLELVNLSERNTWRETASSVLVEFQPKIDIDGTLNTIDPKHGTAIAYTQQWRAFSWAHKSMLIPTECHAILILRARGSE